MNNMVKKTLILYYSLCLFFCFHSKFYFRVRLLVTPCSVHLITLSSVLSSNRKEWWHLEKQLACLSGTDARGVQAWQTEPCAYKSLEYHEHRLICGGVSLAELIIQTYLKSLNKCECDCYIEHEDVEQFQNMFNKWLSCWNILMIKQYLCPKGTRAEQHTHIRNQEILDYLKVPELCHVWCFLLLSFMFLLPYWQKHVDINIGAHSI